MAKASKSKQEYDKEYNARPEQKKNRAKRNKARAEAAKEGRVKKGDGKDVDHIKKLANGGSNTKANTRVRSASANRGDNLKRGGNKPKGKGKK
ncbi:MAG: HNH endonuclease [Planctomycetes bacterium]|nr:HNH endonuclease [Planctomycetota bacterium]